MMAMNMDVDDFHFDLQVLNAKINTLLKRTYSFSKEFHILSYHNIYLDLLLTKNKLKILEYLFEHVEIIISRIDLMNYL